MIVGCVAIRVGAELSISLAGLRPLDKGGLCVGVGEMFSVLGSKSSAESSKVSSSSSSSEAVVRFFVRRLVFVRSDRSVTFQLIELVSGRGSNR